MVPVTNQENGSGPQFAMIASRLQLPQTVPALKSLHQWTVQPNRHHVKPGMNFPLTQMAHFDHSTVHSYRKKWFIITLYAVSQILIATIFSGLLIRGYVINSYPEFIYLSKAALCPCCANKIELNLNKIRKEHNDAYVKTSHVCTIRRFEDIL